MNGVSQRGGTEDGQVSSAKPGEGFFLPRKAIRRRSCVIDYKRAVRVEGTAQR